LKASFSCVALSIFLGFLSSAYGSNIEPGDNLITDGIPPISKEIAQNVLRYTESRSASLVSWHPLKQKMLILTRFAETPQVHAVEFPMGARKQMTFFPDRVASAVFEPKNGSYFVFSKDTNGSERFQNYRYDLSTGESTLLTDGNSKNSLGVWSRAGDRMAYESTRRNGKDVDFYQIDPADPLNTRSHRIIIEFNQGDAWSILDWSPDDKKLLAMQTVSINESYLWIIDVAAGEKELLTTKTSEGQVSYRKAKFTQDGKGVIALTDKNSEFVRLASIDLASREHTDLDSNDWDVENFALSPDSMWIAFVVNEGGISVLHLLNRRTNKDEKVSGVPMGVISDLRWHPSSKMVGFSLSSARSPMDVFSLNIESGDVIRWTKSEIGGLDAIQLTKPQLIHWNSFDQMWISGYLYSPPSHFTGKRPVMVVIHGGPESQFRPIYLGQNNYFLNEMGVVLIYPNIRGSSGYGKTFLKLDNGYLREHSYKDIGALLDWIKKQPNLDGDKIMVSGTSYGGHVTLAVATLYNDKIACSLDVVGMSNLVTFLENTEAYRKDLRRVEYGDERDMDMRAFLNRIAPLTNASNIKKPLFIIQGLQDPRVPASEAQQMVAAVKANATPVRFLAATNEGHGFVKKHNRDFQFYATISFMEEYLLNSDKK
jgi:dipeptidyl aminopeptidase/acylaminoacyl peptidase